MKKIILPLLAVFLTIPLFSQANFSGKAEMNITANAPESLDSESLFSRDDLGISDLSMLSSLTAKIDAGDEKTTFSAWFSLGESTDPERSDYSLNLLRLSALIYISNTISVETGRQSMLTGYGYGWNPIDFANPQKDPSDPDAELKGVDAVSLRIYPNETISLKLYAILPESTSEEGWTYGETKAGTEMTLYLPGVEWMLSGFWDDENTQENDAYTPALGTAAILDLWGAGIYSELALRKGSRNLFPTASSIGERKTDWLFSGLLGLEYTFKSGLSSVVEYFYNGEGYNKSERSDFETALPIISDLFDHYAPGYFGRHYFLLNLSQPFYDINTEMTISALIAPDSGALTLLPAVTHNFSGSFSVQFAYTGLFDLDSHDFNELSAWPIRHSMNALCIYSF
jgi:hypothetical protein